MGLYHPDGWTRTFQKIIEGILLGSIAPSADIVTVTTCRYPRCLVQSGLNSENRSHFASNFVKSWPIFKIVLK